jgi:flagellar biosynthesis/type III secretory pathway protein FliH
MNSELCIVDRYAAVASHIAARHRRKDRSVPQRPDSHTLAADRLTLQALQDLSDYQPLNPAYRPELLQQLEASLDQAEEAEERARRAFEQARRVRTDTARAFHDAIVGAKRQVLAQYGPDSLAVQAIGLTRASERKRPARRVSAA